MPFQTSVNSGPDIGSAGTEPQKSDGFRDVQSFVTSAAVSFGTVVSQAANGTVSAGGTAFGIALAGIYQYDSNTDASSAEGDIDVMRKGYVVVAVAGTVAQGSVPKYNSNGEFVAAVTSGTNLTNARYETGTTGAGLAIVRIDN